MALRLSTALRNAILTGGSNGGFKDAIKYGIIYIYSGSQPASADAAETGTILVKITLASGAFVSGVTTNGLSLGTAGDGAIAKASEVWSGVGLAAGTAGWYRFYGNTVITGLVTNTGIRLDGSCATSGSQLNMSSTTIAVGATTTIDTATWTLPAS